MTTNVYLVSSRDGECGHPVAVYSDITTAILHSYVVQDGHVDGLFLDSSLRKATLCNEVHLIAEASAMCSIRKASPSGSFFLDRRPTCWHPA